MSQLLLETLHYENGALQNVIWHNRRFNDTRKQLFGQAQPLDLEAIFEDFLAQNAVIFIENIQKKQLHTYQRCRILYNKYGVERIEIVETLRRNIKTVQLIAAETLDYTFKYADRTGFDTLSKNIKADEMLIVKEGFLTDTTYANIVLLEKNKWITPSKPLLKGTKRAKLLAKQKIYEADVTPQDLYRFREMRLINATTDLENSPRIDIQNIAW